MKIRSIEALRLKAPAGAARIPAGLLVPYDAPTFGLQLLEGRVAPFFAP